MNHNCSLAKAINTKTHLHFLFYNQKNKQKMQSSLQGDISKSELLSTELTVDHGKQ